MSKSRKWPKYAGPHNPSGLAYVWHKGRQVYLKGHPYGSPESHEAYRQWCREHIDGQPTKESVGKATVSMLFAQFMEHAQERYHGGELAAFKSLAELVVEATPGVPVNDFGPLALRSMRDRMVELGWSRKYVNHQVERIRRVFKWGVSMELVKPETLIALRTVDGLRSGKTAARETAPVLPVSMEHVEATIAELGPVVAAMVRVQASTGMRSSSLCRMTKGEVDFGGELWVYRPAKHKTAHHGKLLAIPIGPKAMAAAFPFLFWRGDDEPLFSPQDSARLHYSKSARNRKTKPKGHWKTRFGAPPIKYNHRANSRIGNRYTSMAYCRAIQRACERAGVPIWTPHRLRHTVATAIREKHGIEAARVYLGHASIKTTEIYAERDFELSARIAKDFG